MITRRYCIVVFVMLFLSCTNGNRIGDQPNIILIMCDDLGWGDTGFNGNNKIKTPQLDDIAKKGMVFSRFYSASPVCSPTRGSCLTGRNPYRLGIPGANIGHLKKEEITIAELLKLRGYTTGLFGKWHLGTLTTELRDANRGRPGDSTHYSTPDMHGFDTYFATESKVPTYDPMIKPVVFDTLKGENLRYGWKEVGNKTEAASYGTYYWKGNQQIETDNLESDNSRVIVDRLIPFIEESIAEEKPFFAVVWLHTPHLPVVANEEMMKEYKGFSHRQQIYYSTITAMDNQVGRIWDKLEAMEQAENTMIWFSSDNGPENNTPGDAGIFRERKRSLYEGGVRVPAFFVWQKMIKGGQRTSFPAVTSDYLPTIVDVLGLDYPSGRIVDGVNLKDVIYGNLRDRHKPIGFQYGSQLSWVTHQYKLISTDKGKTFELYDLLNDPSEQRNIISSNTELADQMKTALLTWIASCKKSERREDY